MSWEVKKKKKEFILFYQLGSKISICFPLFPLNLSCMSLTELEHSTTSKALSLWWNTSGLYQHTVKVSTTPVRELTRERVQGEVQTQHWNYSVPEVWITACSHQILQPLHGMSLFLSSSNECFAVTQIKFLNSSLQIKKLRQLKAYNLGYDLQYSSRERPFLAKKKCPELR